MSEAGHTEDAQVVWILVDHSARAEAFASVARHLSESGVRAEVVTITEVIGQMTRDALAGSAERVLRGLRVVVQGRSSDEDLLGALRRVRPDLLAVTNPRHVRALSVLESLTGIPALQVGVLPDFNLHQAWAKSGLHAFVVPHEELGERLTNSGIDSERVLVAGPAVAPGFARALDRNALRDEFGFPSKERIIIARAETFAVADLEKLVFQLKLIDTPTRILFHHNGDNAAASTLRRAANEYGVEAVMFGRVDELERYLALADAIVTRADDPLMPEVIALGLPVMMVGSTGDAAEQAEFLTRHRMGRHIPDMLRLGSEMERFLEEEHLSRYAEAASSIGLPGGSKEVAEALAGALEHADEWRGGRDPRLTDDGGDAPRGDSERGEDGSTARGGLFESIGDSGRGARSGEGGRGEQTDARSTSGESGGNEYAGISRAEAKEQLAQLILVERDLERRLSDLSKEQERWRSRLDMAREWHEDDLAEEAEEILRGYMQEAEPLEQELRDVRRQKSKLKDAADVGERPTPQSESGGGEQSSRMAALERRFRKMEEDRELDSLKDRINRELGD